MKLTREQLRNMREELEETVRHLDYELAVARSRLAWVKHMEKEKKA